MLTQEQNTIVYLMLLNGFLFLGLNRAAHAVVNPGPKGSKRRGYALIVSALSVLCVQQEYRALIFFAVAPATAAKILLGGFVIPVLFLSLAYYRIQKKRALTKQENAGQTGGAASDRENH
ncbi:MAG: hypothetical protein HY579_00750 [Nitrospinae bacterium]|nr:hypothetical protein [Nitrospinota bacterium]